MQYSTGKGNYPRRAMQHHAASATQVCTCPSAISTSVCVVIEDEDISTPHPESTNTLI